MIFELLNLELKQLFRSSALAKNVMVNVLAGFTILFLFTQLLIIGASLPHFIYSFTGNPDSLWVVNTYLAHYFVMEFLMRYLVQKVPGANIAPLLHLPVKKTLLTAYLLGKSLFSPYNMVVMCIFIPFTLRVVVPEYGNLAGLFWFGTIFMISLSMHWGVIFYKLKTDHGLTGFFFLLLPILLILGAEYMGWMNILSELRPVFEQAYLNHVPLLAAILIMATSLYAVFRSYLLHTHVENNITKAQYDFYNFTPGIFSRFGSRGDIASLEWRLIIRHKKGRTFLFTSVLFLLYGFAFYTNPEYFRDDGSFNSILLLPAMFITGMFGINFGQLFLSWNSPHFDFYMNRPGGIQLLIRGKFLLYLLIIIFTFILSLFYAFFGWQILYLHLAAFLFNVGINLHIIIWFALWQPKPVNLNAGGTWNMEGMGCAQFLLIVPVLGLPLAIILILSAIFNQTIALIVLGAAGTAGLLAFPLWTNLAIKKVLNNRYHISSTFRKES